MAGERWFGDWKLAGLFCFSSQSVRCYSWMAATLPLMCRCQNVLRQP